MIFIRSLMIVMLLTTASYGEQAQEPEKTFFQKIAEIIFPEEEDAQASEKSLSKTEEVPNTTTIGEKEKAPTHKIASEKKTQEVADKTTSGKNTKEASNKLPEKPLPEISMGRKDAPVVMINYSSLSCGHCAHFNSDILPQIEKKYIKPGYLRIVFRDYPGDQVSLRAHQLAWCKGEIKYLDFMKILYANQDKWLFADDPVVALKAIALQNGIPAQQFESCLKNQELLNQIIAIRLDGQKKYSITATPTIVINAKIYQKALSLEELDDIMKPLLVSSAEKLKKS